MKGNIAKENVTKKLIEVFGADYIGEFDKKLYVWANDGNDRVQIAIALSHPKIYRGVEETGTAELNFDDEPPAQPSGFKPVDISQEEQNTLAELMKKLGL